MFTGCLPPKTDLRDYSVSASAGMANLPETYEVKRYGKIKNQGSVSSCVAHATSSILETINKMSEPLSTNFIYGVHRNALNRTQRGMYLADACKTAVKYGDMLEVDCKGNNETPTCVDIAKTSLSDSDKASRAKKYKINSYYNCPTPQDIKFAIYKYGPVLACVKWYDKYSIGTDSVIKMNTSTSWGYHAIMLYGWNEKGFLFQNSWGASFGKRGVAVYPYDSEIAEAKCLVDNQTADTAGLIQPQLNWFTNIAYKVANFFINLFKKN